MSAIKVLFKLASAIPGGISKREARSIASSVYEALVEQSRKPVMLNSLGDATYAAAKSLVEHSLLVFISDAKGITESEGVHLSASIAALLVAVTREHGNSEQLISILRSIMEGVKETESGNADIISNVESPLIDIPAIHESNERGLHPSMRRFSDIVDNAKDNGGSE